MKCSCYQVCDSVIFLYSYFPWFTSSGQPPNTAPSLRQPTCGLILIGLTRLRNCHCTGNVAKR